MPEPTEKKKNLNSKRKDILLPLTKDGNAKLIGFTNSKKLKIEKVGIRLFTQPRKTNVINYLGRKKTRKYVTCMLSIFDESDGPPNPATVMRVEIMHPESGEMVIYRVGPLILKRASLIYKSPNRFEIAEYIMNELIMTEYINTNDKTDTLPPRMLTLSFKEHKGEEKVEL